MPRTPGRVRRAASHKPRAAKKRSAAARRPAKKRSAAARRPANKASAARRRRIDFSKIKWGTFTKRFKAWKKRHPRQGAKVTTLREFAAYILAHPDRFSLHARRKALFYRNIILKGKVKMTIKPYRGKKSKTTRSSRRSKVGKRAKRVKRAKRSMRK
jgi:hypothetical protein